MSTSYPGRNNAEHPGADTANATDFLPADT